MISKGSKVGVGVNEGSGVEVAVGAIVSVDAIVSLGCIVGARLSVGAETPQAMVSRMMMMNNAMDLIVGFIFIPFLITNLTGLFRAFAHKNPCVDNILGRHVHAETCQVFRMIAYFSARIARSLPF